MKDKIISQIHTECPWRDTLYWYNSIDSTNTQAKLFARNGAPHGTALIAGEQTGGRGRMGRSFESKAGKGVYLSVILRPNCTPDQLMHLTCAVGVAVCDAVEAVSGIRPGIKWINDLVWNKRKLGGILTEMAADPKTGVVDYAIIGIGINCLHSVQDFSPEVASIATSLSIAAGKDICTDTLAAAMVESLYRMSNHLFVRKAEIMDTYRRLCVTLGQDILVHHNNTVTPGKALNVDSEGALTVLTSDGQQITVNSGEVSVRGMYGYL